MYAKHLSRFATVSVYCIDGRKPRLSLPGVAVHYGKFGNGNRLIDLLRIFYLTSKERSNFDLFLIKYLVGSSLLLTYLGRKKTVLDFRTLSVERSWVKRALLDSIAILESWTARYLTAVSQELGKKFGTSRYTVVRLGAEISDVLGLRLRSKKPKTLRLLYVGTLHNRELETLVRGLAMFLRRNSDMDVSLNIVGSGYSNEKELLMQLASQLNLSNSVSFFGDSRGAELDSHYSKSHLGIVHVPDKSYYACQPSTKLFEYWAHNLPVLASEYRMTIDKVPAGSGLLYKNDPEGFAQVLEQIAGGKLNPNYELIRILAAENTWDSIVISELLPLLRKVANLG